MANETELDQDATGEQSNQTGSDASVQTEMETQKLFEVNGQKMTGEQLAESYANLQKDYTKKTQEIAKSKSAPQESTTDDAEVETVKKTLKSMGFLSQEDLDSREKAQQEKMSQAKELDNLMDSNPDLAPYRSAIEAIAKTDNSAFSDIAVKYGFSTSDRIQKAKSSGSVMGEPIPKVQPKAQSVKDLDPMSPEYEAWRKANLFKSKNLAM